MSANDLVTSHRKVVAGSDRSFGLVFAGFFALIALFPAVHGAPIRWWALIVTAVFAIVALAAPHLLHPLNRAWFALGMLLHHVVNPVVMALMFYGAILPMSLLLRWLGKDILRLQREPDAATYWIAREPPAPAPDSMKKQF
jgi:hypothetical protein